MQRREFFTGATCVLLGLTPATHLLASEGDRVFAVSSGASASLNAQIIAQTNAIRRSAGRSALKQSPELMRAAQDYAGKLAAAGKLSHSLGGADPGKRARAAGFNWRAIGENIVVGSARGSEEQIAASLIKQWMDSNGHRKNILATKYNFIGVGVFQNNGRAYGVQIFGKPR